MVDMNDFESWAQGSWCYEYLMVIGDMSYFGSWSPDSGCYEQLMVVDNMNESRSHEIKPLDAKENLGLWMIWKIISHEPMSLNDMNKS